MACALGRQGTAASAPRWYGWWRQHRPKAHARRSREHGPYMRTDRSFPHARQKVNLERPGSREREWERTRPQWRHRTRRTTTYQLPLGQVRWGTAWRKLEGPGDDIENRKSRGGTLWHGHTKVGCFFTSWEPEARIARDFPFFFKSCFQLFLLSTENWPRTFGWLTPFSSDSTPRPRIKKKHLRETPPVSQRYLPTQHHHQTVKNKAARCAHKSTVEKKKAEKRAVGAELKRKVLVNV